MRRSSCVLALWGFLMAPALLAPAQAAEPLRVEVGKSRLLNLKQDPAVVMIGDPSVADVVIEEGRRMFVLGMEPGETNLHILDADGAALMNVRLVVTPQRSGHVSVHRGVEEATLSCSPRCAGVRTPAGTGAVRASNAPPASALLGAGAAPVGAAPPGQSAPGRTDAPPASGPARQAPPPVERGATAPAQ